MNLEIENKYVKDIWKLNFEFVISILISYGDKFLFLN